MQKRIGRLIAGFSLVELIVVIGIISLLIAILLPALHKAQAQSKWVTCQAQMRTIGQAMLIYANSNHGILFPPDQGLDVPINERWFLPVLRPPPPTNPESVDAKDWTPPIMLCPADDLAPENYHSYLVNHHLVEHGVLYSTKPPDSKTPDRVIVMGEKMTNSTNYYVEILNGQSTYAAQVEEHRHGLKLGSNYLYMDLHVDNTGPDKVIHGADPWDFD